MGKLKVKLELSISDFKKLADYLNTHERDIARCNDDYDDLKGVFVAIFEEEPDYEGTYRPDVLQNL